MTEKRGPVKPEAKYKRDYRIKCGMIRLCPSGYAGMTEGGGGCERRDKFPANIER